MESDIGKTCKETFTRPKAELPPVLILRFHFYLNPLRMKQITSDPASLDSIIYPPINDWIEERRKGGRGMNLYVHMASYGLTISDVIYYRCRAPLKTWPPRPLKTSRMPSGPYIAR